jgi:peroxiredoxin
MARTPSTMVELNTLAHPFELTDTDGQIQNLDSLMGDKGILVAFICNHCPFVIHIMNEFSKVAANFQEAGIGVVAINSNDVVNYPDDHPDLMKTFKEQYQMNFPYLFDETQDVAKSYLASCTPDFFLYNNKKELVYRGQMDDSRPGNDKPIDGHNLNLAVEALTKGRDPLTDQTPSLGCNIKWKKGFEPDYYGN